MAAGTESRRSRRELEDLVQDQRDQLQKYETRLRDVVRAYKGLAKEKEALDQTVAALGKGGAAADDGNAGLETLTSAVKTLTAEKARLESDFQEDRKKLRAEKQRLEEEKKELAEDKERALKKVDEMKSKWIVERHQRDKDTDDSALVMRELQKVVAEERRGKEELEAKLQKALRELNASGGKSFQPKASRKQEDPDKIQRLEAELVSRDEMLKELECKRAAEVEELRREMEASRRQNQRALERAEARALQAEKMREGVRTEQEVRVVNLEAKLQGLSDAVGSYDRFRQEDQSSICRLKERVQQLESEKSTPSEDDKFGDDDSNLDVQSLMDRMMRLKTLLTEANRRSENPINLEVILNDGDPDSLVGHWKKLCQQLRDEVESHKKACSALSSIPSKSPSRARLLASQDEDISRLEAEVSGLKSEIAEMAGEREADRKTICGLKLKEVDLKSAIMQAKAEAKESHNAVEQSLKRRIVQLEAELAKQRERCLTIIDEKEDEVAMLKSSMEATIEAAFRASLSTQAARTPNTDSKQLIGAAAASIVSSASKTRTKRRHGSVADSVADDLTATSTHQTEGMVLYYEEELAHKEAELVTMKEKAREFEATLRDLQMNFVGKEERYLDDIESLRSRVDTLQRMSTKEGANMEYLKNVVLTYMLSSDDGPREHILKAIATVLSFSKDDLAKVHEYNASWFRWRGTQADKRSQHAKLFKGGGAP